MKMYVVRAAAFVVGSLIAGCVYAARDSAPAKGEVVRQAVAVYPSATMTSGDPDGDYADVALNMPMVGMHFVAARYRCSASPARVEAFYRSALERLGPVHEQSGGPHTRINGFVWRQGPDQMTLAEGKTIIGVEPHGSGAEFAIITIDASPNR
jgi:hypothetical protein